MNPLLAHAGDAHFFSMEHVHVMLNHLPVIGLAMAILALALALKHRSRKVEIVALILVFVAAASALPVVLTGQRAYKTVRELTDEAGAAWLDEHMERAERTAPVFYALALLALASIALPHKWPGATRPLLFSTFGLALLCAGAGGWIAFAGGNVRHPEFRSVPTPEAKSDGHQHDHGGEKEKPQDKHAPAQEQTSTQQPAGPTKEQIEASRMQLEASRAQLEASRKLLEATPASPAQTPAAGATPSPHPPGASPAPKPADGHKHKH